MSTNFLYLQSRTRISKEDHFLLSLKRASSLTPPPPISHALANMANVSICHTKGRKAVKEEGEVALIAQLATGQIQTLPLLASLLC